jgi:DNA repair protein RecN (Recombination protein N)
VLHELHIAGLGVIDDLELELDPGLNVLTGETGTGKTMVTVGLALALGRRAGSHLVRAGSDAARVQARFDAPDGADAEGWVEDGETVLARTITAQGRGAARIGRQLVPVSALAELGGGLVEVHGQREGHRLLSSGAQTQFLDRYAGGDHLRAVQALAGEHETLRNVRAALGELDERERDREREMDLLAYQVREIEASSPRPGELAELRLEEARLAHAERLLDRAAAAERHLSADGGAGEVLGSAVSELAGVADLDATAGELAARAEGLAAEGLELEREVRAYRERLELDPARLGELRDRIGALDGLMRKYGPAEEDVLAFLERARARLEELAGSVEERTRLSERARELGERVTVLAAAVSDGRSRSAPELGSALTRELAELGMVGARVEVTLAPNTEVTAAGAERVEFVFGGGPGQPALPLSKVASGGELSRTMLACRAVLVDLDDVPTLVFDEVDAGIGGHAGVAVGRRLAAIAASRQVIVVTHLPQIASFADRHVRVRKVRGRATVEVLDDAGRVEELSRMLSGLPGSDTAATHAEELLAEAGRSKRR